MKVVEHGVEPTKVAKWIKVVIQILVIIASAIGGDLAQIVSLLNL